VTSAAKKKKSKKTDIEMDNKVNAIKLTQMKSVDENQKPMMNAESKKDKKNTKKPPPDAMNDVKIQVCQLV